MFQQPFFEVLIKTRFMRNTFFSLFLLFPLIAVSQKIDNTVSFRDIESNSYFRFNYENDVFAEKADENYTQGYNLELVLPILKKNPINHLFFKPKESNYKYGISWEHIGFTPNDYGNTDIQFGDRPFASAIYLKSFAIATDTTRHFRISQSLSLGMIGEIAFGQEMQTGIHKVIGSEIPKGWRNQIRNGFVLNYRLNFEKQLLELGNIFNLQASSSIQVGTLFTQASIGTNAMFGIVNSPLSSNQNKKKIQLYLYAQPLVSAIAFDATLQGGVFNKNSPYTIGSKNIERFTSQLNYGLVLKTRKLYFEYSRSAISREFESRSSAKWGGLRFGFVI